MKLETTDTEVRPQTYYVAQKLANLSDNFDVVRDIKDVYFMSD